MVYAVIRIRGSVNVNPDIKKTLHLLRLNRANHCVLIQENKVNKGMLQRIKDYATWGEITQKTIEQLISKRGMITGDKPVNDEYVKTATSYKDISDLAKAIAEKKIEYKEIPEVKPLFRLNPPKKGYEGVKRSYKMGGALGYRGKDMNHLVERMLS